MKSYHLTQEQALKLFDEAGGILDIDDKCPLAVSATDLANTINLALDKVLGEQWISVEDRFPVNERVITFSPAYEEGEHMRHRVMDGQFVKVCFDVTHWMPLPSAPKEKS